MSVQHVMIATPCYGGQITTPFFQSTITLNNWLRQERPTLRVDWNTISGESLIPRARNNAVREFLKSDAEILVFIDADIEFTPQHLERLIDSGFSVSAQAYPLKRMDFKRIADANLREPTANDLRLAGIRMVVNAIGDHRIGGHGFARCFDAGTGFMAIRRQALEEMVENYPDLRYVDEASGEETYALFDTMLEDGRYLSEDYAFCRRWQALGGFVYVDMETQILIHHGSFAYGQFD